MKILFDGAVFEQELSGIAKSTLCIYEACHELDDTFKAYGLVGNNIPDVKSNAIQWIKISDGNVNKVINEEHIKYIHLPNNGIQKYDTYGLKRIGTINDVLPLQIPGYFGDVKNELLLKHIYHKFRSKIEKYKYSQLMQNNISQLSLIFTISDFSKQSIFKYFSPKCPVITIPLGNTLSSGDVENNKENYIIYWGGYHPRKGIDKLVSAFITYKNKSASDIKLLIVGKKNSLGKECDNEILTGVNKGYIQELGYLSDNQLKSLILKAKALFYLSAYEGFGLPIIEAMALGCPVVTTDKTSCGEIAGDAAVFVNCENQIEIINALENIDNDVILRNNQIKKGIKQAKKYSWEEAARLFLSELKD